MKLSPRELQVLQGYNAGKRQRQICADLFLAQKTVSHHRSTIVRKFGLEDGASDVAIVDHGRRIGLVTMPVNP